MIAEFATPLQAMLRPENRSYTSPEFLSSTPTPAELGQQLEGLWPGLAALPAYRQRAIHQLVSRIRRLKAHDSKWSFLTLGATIPADDVASEERAMSAPVEPVSGPVQAAQLHFDAESLALIDDAASRHAYTATVSIALIQKAKETSGILPSTDFLWARSKDLHFWHLINAYGRPRQKKEVVGAFAHFDLERKRGEPVPETYFDLAEFGVRD